MWQEVQLAARMLRRRPGFTLVAVLTLALGIGANSAIFSVVDGVLLSPLPLHEPERLVSMAAESEGGFSISVSIPNYRSWRERARTFESMALYRGTSLNLTGGDQPERLEAQQLLGDFFGTLGRQPALGRGFGAAETEPGAEPVAVLSHGLWLRRFGSDPAAVGRPIMLDGRAFTVVGVMPQDFTFLPRPNADLWVPMGVFADTLPWDARGSSSGTYVVARLRAGVTLEQARADMEAVGRQVREDTGWTGRPVVAGLRDVTLQQIESTLFLLAGAVIFVLLIACANVANLLLVRADERHREIALRAALGAPRSRLLRQLLVESVVLAGCGGVLGIALSALGVQGLLAFLPAGFPLVDQVGLDARVVGFTVIVSLVTGVAFGVVPAILGSRSDLQGALKEGGRTTGAGSGRAQLRAAFVLAEVVLALVLLVGAGLMLRSLSRLGAVDPGFRPEGVMTMRVSLPPADYPDFPRWYGLYGRLLDRVETLPGVRSVGVSNGIPLSSGGTEAGCIPDSRPFEQESFESCLYQSVSGDYFRTLGIPQLVGRAFTRQDVDGRPLVAIVDESMAREFWPGESPLGRRLAFEVLETAGGGPPEPIWREVVGVVGHVRYYELRSRSRVQVYVPYTQPPIWFSDRRPPLAVFVDSDADSVTTVSGVRRELGALDPNLPIYEVQTMEATLSSEVGTDRVFSGVLTAFASAALLLAAVGIYGVLAYSVARRTQEIGLRMALGARRRDVVGLVARQTLVLTVAGVGIGWAVSLGVARVLESQLFEVSATDPMVFLVVPVVLTVVALVASYMPARRASTVDPVVALRYE